MSKTQGPGIPGISFQADPNVGWSQDQLKSAFNYLNQGLTTPGGSLSGMMGDTVNLNPDISRLATEQYVSAQEPTYRRGLQDITNTLEANNQLTGSTTGNVLQNYQNDYLAGLTSANAEMQLVNIDRALSNRVGLYSTGLNAVQQVGSNALQNQNQMNTFALENFDNQLAKVMSDYNTQQQNAGFWGSLAGSFGGPGTGALVGGLTGGRTGSMAGTSAGWGTVGAIAGLMGGSGSGATSQANRMSPYSVSSGRETIYNPSTTYVAGQYKPATYAGGY